MSSEKTADMFKNKSEEEIMNWMIRYMTPEQIKSCFEGDVAVDDTPVPSVKSLDVDDLRKFCANKRYVIHKIEDEKVYFWYYLVKKETWQYSIEPLSNFPQTMGQEADECGADTSVSKDFEDELRAAYNKNSLDDNNKFFENNPTENEYDIFNKVKNEYSSQGINEDWKDVLLTALNIQQSVPVLSDEKVLINFAPVLIESVTGNKVNYYYLMNDSGEVKFVEGNLSIDKFRDDLIEIIDDLNLQISVPGQPAGASAKTVDEWTLAIREAANNIYSSDLERIKEIYDKFPLSKESPFFIKNLFGETSSNDFGKTIDLNRVNLSEYVKNTFGTNTAMLFNAKLVSNKFGTQTITLVPK